MDEHLKQVRKDVDDMNRTFGDQIVTDAPKTEVPGTKAPGTNAPSTNAPGTEAPGTTAPGTDAPKTEAPSTKAPSTEVPTTEAPKESLEDRLTRENEALRGRIEDMSGVHTKAPGTSAPKTAAPATEPPISEYDFLGDKDLDELTRDPKEFNKLLNEIYAKAVKDTKGTMTEGVLRSIPDIVKTNVFAITELKKASDKFYDDNKDLVPFKRVVSAVFEEVAAAKPDKKYDELLGEVATETRTRLELHKKTVEDDKTKHPNLPSKRNQQRQRQTKPDLTGIEKEIDTMNETLNQ